jgi:hypothetical protein
VRAAVARYSKAQGRAAVSFNPTDLVCCRTLQGHSGKVGALEMTLPFPPVRFMRCLRFYIVAYDWKCWELKSGALVCAIPHVGLFASNKMLTLM